jgi:hypothetical protein
MTATGRSVSRAGGPRLAPLTLVAIIAASCVGGEIQTAEHPDRAACPAVPCEQGEVCDNGVCVPDSQQDAAADTTAAPQQILVTPTLLNFANPTVGNEMTGTVTVSNIGGLPLTIRDLNLEDHSPTHDFHMSAPARPFTLDPAAAGIPVTIALRLSDASIPSGILHVSSDDPQTAHVPVQLTTTFLGDAMLDICVLLGVLVSDGCNENPADQTPYIEFQDVPIATSASQVVALNAVGTDGLVDHVQAIRFASSEPIDDYSLQLFTRDSAGTETLVDLPHDLIVGFPQTELRVRVTFAANRGGAFAGVSLAIDTSSDATPTATSTIPIFGNVTGCGSGDVLTDPQNCGYCGHVCLNDHGTVGCSNGICQPTCDPPTEWADCDGVLDNGCESSLDLVGNCGVCGNTCTVTNTEMGCINKTCTMTGCAPGYADCNHTASDGCEGSGTTGDCCGHLCTNDHGTAQCVNGECAPTCGVGWGDCDGNKDNGCEAAATLGSCCGVTCTNAHGSTTCEGGICKPVCAPGYGDCDGNPDNGCEDQVTTADCCGHTCTNAHGTTSCQGGVCVPVCDTGWGNCDGNADNGCEAAVSDVSCCGRVCQNPHGTTACQGGVCVPVCAAGYGDCDGNPTNGCEAAATPADCCGTTCTNANGGVQCVNLHCAPTCAPGFYDCDGNPNNGCEEAVSSGDCCGSACTNAHGSTVCQGGVCKPTCASNWFDCDGNPANGCEGQAITGSCCGKSCTNAHGSTTCVAGICTPVCAANYYDCDHNPDNGCEGNATTADCCGHACTNANGSTSCTNGLCKPVCSTGYGDCNGNPDDGCEAAVTTADCCGVACANGHGTTSCVGGVCVPVCDASYYDCDRNPANGCEGGNTVASCCGKTCTNDHGTTACTNGVCVPSCAAGWADCDGNPANGCETSLATLENCGGCGVACAPPRASASCSTGTCTITGCDAGYGNCNGNVDDGCETNILTTAGHCGGCGQACSANHVPSPVCTGGQCTGACATGWSDCNNDKRTDGCEVDPNTNVNNCGGCGRTCSTNNITAACSGGACTGTCAAGWGDCNSDKRTDGCEVNILTAPANCGACGQVCSNNHISTPSCAAGTCNGTCDSGWGDCNGNKLSDGCETNINTTVAHCGGCGQACSANNITAACTSGQCTGTCNAGFDDCNGNKRTDGCEININTNISNCGGCGQGCSTNNITAACSGGACTGTCTAGWGDCNSNKRSDGCETNILTAPGNCGACGQSCSSNHITTPSCAAGSCNGTCDAGWADCNSNKLSDGCETDIASNPSNCGTCGRVCSGNHVPTPTCGGGTCNGACESGGWTDCNGNKQTDGCEINILTSPDSCGTCGTVCSSNNMATRTCGSGTCNGTCNTGYADCNGNKQSDGCERNIRTVTDCNGCGVTCSRSNATATCATGTCLIQSCNGGWANVDGNDANGCECQTDTDNNSCSSPIMLGDVAAGGSAYSPLSKTVPSGAYDWYTVSFTPQSGNHGVGTPSLDFTTNEASFVFDVVYVCGGAVAGCQDASGASALTTWSFTDEGVTPGFYTRDQPWPTTIYVKVYRNASGMSCGRYQLRAYR